MDTLVLIETPYKEQVIPSLYFLTEVKLLMHNTQAPLPPPKVKTMKPPITVFYPEMVAYLKYPAATLFQH